VLSVSTWTVAALTCAGSGPEPVFGAGALLVVAAGVGRADGFGVPLGAGFDVGLGVGVPVGVGVGVPDGEDALELGRALDGAATAMPGVMTTGRPLPRRTDTITRARGSAFRVAPVLGSHRTAIPPHRDPPHPDAAPLRRSNAR
jgi:hypothetical protein